MKNRVSSYYDSRNARRLAKKKNKSVKATLEPTKEQEDILNNLFDSYGTDTLRLVPTADGFEIVLPQEQK